MRHLRLPVLAMLGASVFATLPGSAVGARLAAPDSKGTDARCLLLSDFFTKSATDPKLRQEAFAAHFYYLGLLHMESQSEDLQPVIAAASKSLRPATASATMQICLKDLQAVESENEQIVRQAQASNKK